MSLQSRNSLTAPRTPRRQKEVWIIAFTAPTGGEKSVQVDVEPTFVNGFCKFTVKDGGTQFVSGNVHVYQKTVDV